ncbi:MAG: class I SAM-dependent methyltransferase, partial [Crocosphaera sp.]
MLEIESLIDEKNAKLHTSIEKLQHSNNQLLDSMYQIQHYSEQNSKYILDIQKSVNILSSPENLIPQLNSYTGKYYMALEYPPSRDYQPRWGYTQPPHP